MENKTFSSKVWSIPEAQEFLLLWGWTEVMGRGLAQGYHTFDPLLFHSWGI